MIPKPRNKKLEVKQNVICIARGEPSSADHSKSIKNCCWWLFQTVSEQVFLRTFTKVCFFASRRSRLLQQSHVRVSGDGKIKKLVSDLGMKPCLKCFNNKFLLCGVHIGNISRPMVFSR